MNPKETSPEERAAALERLLTTYAQAVHYMRNLQREYVDDPTIQGLDELERVEKEVDEMTALHLTPAAK